MKVYLCLLLIQDEKKRSGNAAVVDLPRLPLPVRRPHLRRPQRRPLRHPLHQVHHTHPATVGVALAVVVSVSFKFEYYNLLLIFFSAELY